jgi:hypothetical protein
LRNWQSQHWMNETSTPACLRLSMGRYEGATLRPGDLNSKDSSTSLQSWSNHDGAMAILKVWNDNLSHRTATFIIKQTRRALIKCPLLRNLPLPDWMLNGNCFGEHGLELDYDRIVVRILNLHHASANLQQTDGLQISKAGKLNHEARELDKALQEWTAQIPSTCHYLRHILTKPGPWPRGHFYPQQSTATQDLDTPRSGASILLWECSSTVHV